MQIVSAWTDPIFSLLMPPCRRPQTGVVLLDPPTVDAARMVSFGRNWPLAAPPGTGAVCKPRFKSTGTSGLP